MGVNLRETIKAAARGVAHVLVLPFCVSFTVRAWLLGRDRALMSSTQTLAMVPGLPSSGDSQIELPLAMFTQ